MLDHIWLHSLGTLLIQKLSEVHLKSVCLKSKDKSFTCNLILIKN